MTALFDSLIRASVVSAVPVALAAAAAPALRRKPRLESACWRGVLLVLLLVPLNRMAGLRFPAIHVPPPPVRIVASDPAPAAEPWTNIRYRREGEWPEVPAQDLWLAGVLTVFAALGASAARMHRIFGRAGSTTHERAEEIAARLHGRGTVRVLTHPACRSPFAFGPFRPRIYLPESSREWSDRKLAAVLAHEIGHVAHRDVLWVPAALAVGAVLWFHPAAWIVRRRIGALAEEDCDDAAARAVGNVREYARYLIEVAEESRAAGAPRFGSAFCSLVRRDGLSRRLDRLLEGHRRRPPAGSAGRIAVFLCATAVATAATALRVVALRPLRSTPAALPLLRDLGSRDADARAAALFRLSRWPGYEEDVAPILFEHLGDEAPVATMPRWSFTRDNWAPAKSSWIRPSPGEVAAVGLASMGRRAAPLLERGLESSDPVVRRNAAWAIGELRHPRGISGRGHRELIGRLGDPDAGVRGAAAWALGDMGSREAAPALESCLLRETDARSRREETAALEAVRASRSLESFRHSD